MIEPPDDSSRPGGFLLSRAFDETELREALKIIQARWEPQIKMWFAPYRLIRGTPLEAKIAAV